MFVKLIEKVEPPAIILPILVTVNVEPLNEQPTVFVEAL